MSKIYNPELRQRTLDSCFSNLNIEYDIDALLKKVNEALIEKDYKPIKKRQLWSDIEKMRRMGAPVKTIWKSAKFFYYRYKDPNYSFFKNVLPLEDLEELRSTLNMLGHYRGMPGNEWLEEVISSLECRFGVKPNTEKLIDFDKNDRLQGLKHLTPLIDATVSHKTLNIDYCTYTGKERKITFHPYYMKQYNSRWFVFGWNEERDRIENLALDRIKIVASSDHIFKPNTEINFNIYFNNVIGVTVPTINDHIEVEKIILRFSPERFPYVESKPMHRTQKTIKDNTIQLTLRPTRELYQQIFSFIPDVEVLSPDWFREEIRKRLEENLNKYLSVQKDCTDCS